MKKTLLALIITPVLAQAADNCVLQDRTVAYATATIAERSPIRKNVVPHFNNQKKCVVDFRVRIGNEWHSAFGENVWPGDVPEYEACAVAVVRAENDVRERVGRAQTASEKILVCKDEPRLTTLPNTQVGTVGDIAQFRPHPEYPNRFYHNGTQCKWFVDTNFTGRDVRTFQGIICQIGQDKWVVVDKF